MECAVSIRQNEMSTTPRKNLRKRYNFDQICKKCEKILRFPKKCFLMGITHCILRAKYTCNLAFHTLNCLEHTSATKVRPVGHDTRGRTTAHCDSESKMGHFALKKLAGGRLDARSCKILLVLWRFNVGQRCATKLQVDISKIDHRWEYAKMSKN